MCYCSLLCRTSAAGACKTCQDASPSYAVIEKFMMPAMVSKHIRTHYLTDTFVVWVMADTVNSVY